MFAPDVLKPDRIYRMSNNNILRFSSALSKGAWDSYEHHNTVYRFSAMPLGCEVEYGVTWQYKLDGSPFCGGYMGPWTWIWPSVAGCAFKFTKERAESQISFYVMCCPIWHQIAWVGYFYRGCILDMPVQGNIDLFLSAVYCVTGDLARVSPAAWGGGGFPFTQYTYDTSRPRFCTNTEGHLSMFHHRALMENCGKWDKFSTMFCSTRQPLWKLNRKMSRAL